MIEEHLNSLQGMEIYSIISLLVFFSMFIGISIWMFKLDKKFVKHMSEMPLDKE